MWGGEGAGRRDFRTRNGRENWGVERKDWGDKAPLCLFSKYTFSPTLEIQRGNICLHNCWAAQVLPICLFLVCRSHLSGQSSPLSHVCCTWWSWTDAGRWLHHLVRKISLTSAALTSQPIYQLLNETLVRHSHESWWTVFFPCGNINLNVLVCLMFVPLSRESLCSHDNKDSSLAAALKFQQGAVWPFASPLDSGFRLPLTSTWFKKIN